MESRSRTNDDLIKFVDSEIGTVQACKGILVHCKDNSGNLDTFRQMTENDDFSVSFTSHEVVLSVEQESTGYSAEEKLKDFISEKSVEIIELSLSNVKHNFNEVCDQFYIN